MRMPWRRRRMAHAPAEGSPELREAQRAVREARAGLDQVRGVAQQMAAAKRELDRLRATNHFREGIARQLREEGHRG